jgi:alkylhydroperoxidase family enzyme
MLGRSVGIEDEKISHLGDDPLPEGVFTPEEAAIVRYARASTQMKPITDELYGDLARHFDTQQIMELWATVSMSNEVNRFHATFLTDLDQSTLDSIGPSCPLPLPPYPGEPPHA